MCTPCMPCIPQIVPFAQVTMVTPPPIMPPTRPEPVIPLRLPPGPKKPTPEEEFHHRYSNFYNSYNEDYHLRYRIPPAEPHYIVPDRFSMLMCPPSCCCQPWVGKVPKCGEC